MNTGDTELISQTIDAVCEPDVKQHGPFEATGTQAIKEMVVARLYQAFPDIHITLGDLIASPVVPPATQSDARQA
jgi:hypothetical protein